MFKAPVYKEVIYFDNKTILAYVQPYEQRVG